MNFYSISNFIDFLYKQGNTTPKARGKDNNAQKHEVITIVTSLFITPTSTNSYGGYKHK